MYPPITYFIVEDIMRNPKIGVLPLYIALYDRDSPQMRPAIDAAHANTVTRLKEQGLDVITWTVCRLQEEFAEAIKYFEDEKVDAIVTLHLAYSPSLESAKALASTDLPIIILDTTPTYSFNQYTDASAIDLNHGIHGVQDMCNLLLRNNKKFVICAGHMDHSNVLQKVVNAAKSAQVVNTMKHARVGIVGEPFDGMGDFSIAFDELKADLGVEIVPYDWQKDAERANAVTQEQIDAEYENDLLRFEFDPSVTREIYDRSAKASLIIRNWLEEEHLTGFSVNFLEIEAFRAGLNVMPFTECCTAMTRGIGYAGEGDVLTAALTGSLLSAFEETTFTEMFCPDWEGGALFLSHMGEYNYVIADGKPVLYEKNFPHTSAQNPTAAYKTMKEGRAVLINLAPFGDGRYTLTLAPGQMLKIAGENKMDRVTNGWFKPDIPLETFLEEYSKNGATHHSALVYGDVLEQLLPLADFLGCKCVVIK